MVLVVRAQLARIHLEGEHRGCVEVVAVSDVAGPRPTVAGAPIGELGRRVVGSGDPHWHAARLPRISRPGLAAGFTGCRDRVGLPHFVAGLRVQGGNEAANAPFATRYPDHHLARRDQGRQGHVVARAVVFDLRLPDHFTRRGIERDNETIRSGHVDQVAVQADAPVGGVHLREVLGKVALVSPQQFAARGVQCQHVVVGRGHEHRTVVDHRGRLVAFAHSGRERPDGLEAGDILGVDLIERAVALGVVRTPVHQPVLGLRTEQPFIGHRRVLRRKSGCGHASKQRTQHMSHGFSPRSIGQRTASSLA